MKLLLVRPKMANTLGFLNIVDCEPLELEYLFTVARNHGATPVIYDAMYDPKDLREVVAAEKPDIVAISGYITQEALMKKYAAVVKEIDKSAAVILGGVHAELNPERFYDSQADFIIHSSSPAVFGQLLDSFLAKSAAGAPDIPGICYVEDGVWIKNAPVISDPNDLPIPDRSFFEKTKKHYRYLEFSPCALLKTSYSCPHHCNFCYCRKLNCGHYAVRDIEKVVDEIAEIPCDNIYIVDDDFLVDNRRVDQFITLLKERNIRKNYLIYGRADYVSKNRETLIRLKEVGVCYVMVGLEAFNDSQLTGFNKGVDINQNERCVQVLRECGINCMALMIVNLDFKKEDFVQLEQWILKMDLKYITVSIFTPLPGTDIYGDYRDKLTDVSVEKYDFLHVLTQPLHMSKSEFYFRYYKLFLRIYRIARQSNLYQFVDLLYLKNVFKNYIRAASKT